ncbi:MAG: hypothetical protein AAF184_18670 [Pseudomonadota bacterium]
MALGVFAEIAPAGALDLFLQGGWAAAGLGALYASATASTLPRWRRVSFPAIAAVLNLSSIRTAMPIATAGEGLGLPLGAGLTIVSACWAALFAVVSCAWLRWPRATGRLIVSALAAGASAFALFAWLREATAAYAPLTTALAFYWGLWMTLTSAALSCSQRPTPTRA